MDVQTTSLLFLHGLGNDDDPADQTITIANAGTADLDWTLSVAYTVGAPGWLSFAAGGTVAPSGTVTATITPTPIAATLGAGSYEAVLTVDDPTARAAPQQVTVSLTVSRPVLDVDPVDVTFGDGVVDLSSPGTETFQIRNTGPAYTILYWEIVPAALPAWLAADVYSGSVTGGGSQTVTLTADHAGQAVSTLGHTLIVGDTKGPGVATLADDDLGVIFPVRNQRPEIEINAGAGPITTIDVTCVEGETDSTSTFNVKNVGELTSHLQWSATDDAAAPDWLACNPVSNAAGVLVQNASEQVTLELDASGLPAVLGVTDDYTATVAISGLDPDTVPPDEPTLSGAKQLAVRVNVLKRPQIDFDDPAPSFADGIANVSYPVDDTVTVTLTNSGEVDLSWNAYWTQQPTWIETVPVGGLPTSGTTLKEDGSSDGFTFKVNTNAIGLAAGAHTAVVTFEDQYGGTKGLTLTLYVNTQAHVVASPDPFPLQGAVGGANFPTEILSISNSGEAPLDWAATSNAAWLFVEGLPTTTGSCTSETDYVVVSADTTGLPLGSYFATITVTGVDADNSVDVDVALTITLGDGYENDDDFASAGPIASGETQVHSILPLADRDFVTFDVVGTESVLLELKAAPSDYMYLQLYDASQASLGGVQMWSTDDTVQLVRTLGPGTYYASVEENGNDATIGSYTLRLQIGPELSMLPPLLSFVCEPGTPYVTDSTRVSNTGGGSLNFTVTDSSSAVTCDPTSGGAGQWIDATWDTSGLAPGSYSATVTVTDPAAVGSPVDVPFSITVAAQPAIDQLPFKVIDAEYSEQLEVIVAVSDAPNMLHIYDPVAQSDATVALSDVPVCVSVGPAGLEAVVGFNPGMPGDDDGYLTHVDLSTGTEINSYATTADTVDIVLAGNGYAYVFPGWLNWEDIHCIELSSGTETLNTGSYIYCNTRARLHPNGTVIYGADVGLYPADVHRYDITGGTAANLYDSPYHGQYPIGWDVWFSDDGLSIFVKSGHILTSSDVQAEDLIHKGQLHLEGGIRAFAQSGAVDGIVLIPEAPDHTIRRYQYSTSSYVESVALPYFGGYAPQGRFVFYSADGSKHFVVIQADPSAALANDFGVVTYP